MTFKLVLLGLLSFAAFAQTPAQKPHEVKGLVVASASVDPTTGDLTVGLQNTSSKTIVAYGLLVQQLAETGKIILDSGFGWDFLEPDGDPRYILPGQPSTIWATTARRPPGFIRRKTVTIKWTKTTRMSYIPASYQNLKKRTEFRPIL